MRYFSYLFNQPTFTFIAKMEKESSSDKSSTDDFSDDSSTDESSSDDSSTDESSDGEDEESASLERTASSIELNSKNSKETIKMATSHQTQPILEVIQQVIDEKS